MLSLFQLPGSAADSSSAATAGSALLCTTCATASRSARTRATRVTTAPPVRLSRTCQMASHVHTCGWRLAVFLCVSYTFLIYTGVMFVVG